MNLLKNYVISVSSSHARREHITQEFGKQNIPFEFFDAITPSQLPELTEKFGLNITHSQLTKGEYACLFSHFYLWQQMIDNNQTYIGIFEDDVHLGENADKFLKTTDWINSECKLIKLEHFFSQLILGKAINQYQNRSIKQLKQANLGTAGYIIHQDMAKALIDYMQHLFEHKAEPIDHIMFEQFLVYDPTLKIYQLTPALCIQSDRLAAQKVITSDLENERKKNRLIHKTEKVKLSSLQKIKREIKRLFVQIHHLIFSSKIEFK